MVSSEKIKTAIILCLTVASALVACHDFYVQSENVRLKASFEASLNSARRLENQYGMLMENYSELLSEHQHMLQQFETLNQSYVVLSQNYTSLLCEYQKVSAEYVRLTVDYASLNLTYRRLLQNYTILEQEASELRSKYEYLANAYETLLANYSQVKREFEELYYAIYKPLLSNETVTPSVAELRDWLKKDETDKINYTFPDFVCGDFAVMLSIHAKLNHWDMGVVAVLGTMADGREFNHAFNAIRCKEGLFYVEPQSDDAFQANISEGQWYYHPGFGWIYVDTFVIVVLYQPPLEQ